MGGWCRVLESIREIIICFGRCLRSAAFLKDEIRVKLRLRVKKKLLKRIKPRVNFCLTDSAYIRIHDIVTKFNLLICVLGYEFPQFFMSRSTTFNLLYLNTQYLSYLNVLYQRNLMGIGIVRFINI